MHKKMILKLLDKNGVIIIDEPKEDKYNKFVKELHKKQKKRDIK